MALSQHEVDHLACQKNMESDFRRRHRDLFGPMFGFGGRRLRYAFVKVISSHKPHDLPLLWLGGERATRKATLNYSVMSGLVS